MDAKREDEMAPFNDVKYVYDPEALKTMGAAFDTACRDVVGVFMWQGAWAALAALGLLVFAMSREG